MFWKFRVSAGDAAVAQVRGRTETHNDRGGSGMKPSATATVGKGLAILLITGGLGAVVAPGHPVGPNLGYGIIAVGVPLYWWLGRYPETGAVTIAWWVIKFIFVSWLVLAAVVMRSLRIGLAIAAVAQRRTRLVVSIVCTALLLVLLGSIEQAATQPSGNDCPPGQFRFPPKTGPCINPGSLKP